MARSKSRAADAVAQITGRGWPHNKEVEVLYADLDSQASIRKLAAEILAKHPTLDVLANNAGGVNSSRRLTKRHPRVA